MKIKRLAKGLCLGLAHMHDCNIAHRDVKLDNVLIEDKTNMIKIIDFGFAAFCQDGQK